MVKIGKSNNRTCTALYPTPSYSDCNNPSYSDCSRNKHHNGNIQNDNEGKRVASRVYIKFDFYLVKCVQVLAPSSAPSPASRLPSPIPATPVEPKPRAPRSVTVSAIRSTCSSRG